MKLLTALAKPINHCLTGLTMPNTSTLLSVVDNLENIQAALTSLENLTAFVDIDVPAYQISSLIQQIRLNLDRELKTLQSLQKPAA
jgi:hypothetical protein